MSVLAEPEAKADTVTEPRPYHWTMNAYDRAWEVGVFERDIKLELVWGKIIDRFAVGGPAEYRWTADAFDCACDAGVFGSEARLELIHGRIIDHMGQGPLHSILATLIAERLRAIVPPHLLVREEKPMRIAFDSEPVPDIMIVARAILNSLPHYAGHHVTPEDVALIVEVAVISSDSDLAGKTLLYAQAGIADYWVVLPETRAIIVHRDPTENGYGLIARADESETVAPLAAPEAMLSVRGLLGMLEQESR